MFSNNNIIHNYDSNIINNDVIDSIDNAEMNANKFGTISEAITYKLYYFVNHYFLYIILFFVIIVSLYFLYFYSKKQKQTQKIKQKYVVSNNKKKDFFDEINIEEDDYNKYVTQTIERNEPKISNDNEFDYLNQFANPEFENDDPNFLSQQFNNNFLNENPIDTEYVNHLE